MARDGFARTALTSSTSVSHNLALAGMAEWENSGVALLKTIIYQFQDHLELPLTVAAFHADTAGSGIALDATTTAAVKVYSDDNGAAINPGVMVRAGEFRHLQTDVTGNREEEAVGVIGKLVSVAGVNRHNMCGVMGSYEMKGTIVVDGQIASTDAWVQAGVIGRVGMSTGTVTLNQYGVLAGVAAMSNIQAAVTQTYTGNYVGYYAGRWGTCDKFEYGMYGENLLRAAYFSTDAGAISGTDYSFLIEHAATMSAGGDTMRGLGVFCTPAGVLGAALQGIYSSVDLGTSTHVSGRVAAIEGRIVLGAGSDTQPTESVLCLDFDNGRTTASITNSRSSYIMLRDRGATADLEMYTLLDFFDSTIATDSTNALISTTGDLEATHTLRCMAEDVPLWILCSNVHA